MAEAEKRIKEIIELTLSKMGFEGALDVFETTENIQFSLRMNDAGILIGEEGQNLIALNHIVKRIAEKEFGKDMPQFSLDINDYQRQRAEEIKDMAKMSAQRVRFFKKEIELDPMTSYERRIVHAALTEYPDIQTESTGDEPNRRVIIKPFEGE